MATPDATADAPLLLRVALFGAACGTVYPLLAWVFDLGTFRFWALALALPLTLLVLGTTLWMGGTGRWPATRHAVRAGVLGGLLGTAGYDAFRIPFVYGMGLALLAPIDSYGLLLTGADSSSAWTGIAGWAYHCSNGVGFAVAYAVLFRGRHWGYGIAWAMALESATVLTPFATSYGLRGGPMGTQYLAILLAYAAHVPYGYAIGRAGQNAVRVSATSKEVTRVPALAAIGAVLLLLVVWQRPFTPDDRIAHGRDAAPGVSAVMENGRWYPQWLRIPVRGCITVRNEDDRAHKVGDLGSVDARGTFVHCFTQAGVKRVKVDGRAFSGGFVIVDDQIST